MLEWGMDHFLVGDGTYKIVFVTTPSYSQIIETTVID